MSRAMRRFHVWRLKQKRKHYWHGVNGNNAICIGKIVNTPHPCSCLGCGNDRKYEGITLDEQRKSLECELKQAFDEINPPPANQYNWNVA